MSILRFSVVVENVEKTVVVYLSFNAMPGHVLW